jgi:WD40 repeat protein
LGEDGHVKMWDFLKDH